MVSRDITRGVSTTIGQCKVIERLFIKNFQRHKEFSLSLSSSVTVLAGRSGSGKSSTVRALRWLATNRPQGEDFINHEAKQTKVSLKIDGRKIIRRKGNGKNSCSLDGKQFKSFGAELSTEIVSVLNLGDINFAGQLDQAFWFFLSPGEVAKELNQIVNLSLIDSTLANVAADLRKARSENDVAKERLKTIEENTIALSWVKEADAELRMVEDKDEKASQITRKCERLGVILDGISQAKADREFLQDASDELRTVLNKTDACVQLTQRLEGLQKLMERIEASREGSCHLRQQAEQKSNELKERTKDRCPLCGNPQRK